MRIISGIYKSRVLKSPLTDKVRPTSDRAKETLFNMLTNRIDPTGMTVFDLFCGTGNLGLEAVSRGADKCYFVDEDVRTVKMNIDLLKVQNNAEVIKSEVLGFLNLNYAAKPDLIFCDPPYDYKKYDELIEKISAMNTILILEHSGKFIHDKKYSEKLLFNKKVGTVNFTVYDFS